MADGAALVTVSYRSAGDLRQSWSGFERLTEWIVVDNDSGDESADVARALGARVVESPTNAGFSSANNLGAAATAADVLIFVNPDVTVDETGIVTLVRLCRERRAIVAPQLLNVDGSAQENGRQAPYLYRKVVHFLGRASSAEAYEVTASPGELKRISWAIGAAVAMTREVFDAIGGWDAGFFIYYEDSDICLRAAQRGIPTLLSGDVRWVHTWARETRRRFSFRIWKIEITSMLRFYRRYPRLLVPPAIAPRWRPQYARDMRDEGVA